MELSMELSTTSLKHAGMLSLRPDVVATVLDDGAVLLDLDSKFFYALNSSGWALVQLFEAGASLNDVRAFATASGAPDDESVEDFMSQLCDYGLLEPLMLESMPAPPAPETGIAWVTPTVERQAQPLQKVIVSAFDPSIPLAE
jgi:hypothetical protein